MTSTEAAKLLGDLIRIDTSNPPGNEWPAVDFLAAAAQAAGFSTKTYRTDTNRGNLVVSYNGSYHRPLVLLSHLDVVPAQPDQWKCPPFSGEIVDGEIWGRGSVDTKQLTVMQLAAMINARAHGLEPDRDILLVATADEENGSRYGLLALLEEEPDLFAGAEVITEGGGFPLLIDGTPLYLCQTGQKSVARATVTVREEPGANPFFPSMAEAGRAARLVRRLADFHDPAPIPPTTQALLSVLERLSENSTEADSPLHSLLEAMRKHTLTPTVWRGGKRDRQPGGPFRIEIDARLLPGYSRDWLESTLSRLTEGVNADLQITAFDAGFESPQSSGSRSHGSSRDGGLFDSIRRIMGRRIPEADVAPFLSSGGSDGRFLTGLCDVIYGFSPVLPDLTYDRAISMVHGVDERISVESLWFGAEVLRDVLTDYLAPTESGSSLRSGRDRRTEIEQKRTTSEEEGADRD